MAFRVQRWRIVALIVVALALVTSAGVCVLVPSALMPARVRVKRIVELDGAVFAHGDDPSLRALRFLYPPLCDRVSSWTYRRETYVVAFGDWPPPGCGTGITLWEGDWPLGDPGDEGLEAAAALGHVTRLTMNRTSVTDAGLSALAHLTELEHLALGMTGVTGSGFSALTGLTSLETLDLPHAKVDDPGLAGIAGLPALVTLDLEGAHVSGAGLAHLAHHPTLESLSLAFSRVTDQDVAALCDSHLRSLYLDHSGVTESVIPHLEKMRHLEYVSLCGGSRQVALQSKSKAVREWAERPDELCPKRRRFRR